MNSAQKLNSKTRIPSLDGLRAISIALVLLGHLAGAETAPAGIRLLANYANFGVRVFFVISGFLITGLLLKEHEVTGRIQLGQFYLRRVFRIFPAAYAFLAVMVITARVSLRGRDVVLGFLYLTNYVYPRPWNLGHLWSLAVEEQFYLVWPLLLVCFFQKRRLICGIGIAVPPVVRAVFFQAGLGAVAIENYFPAVADALATGCLLAILQPEMERWTSTVYSRRWFIAIPVATVLLPLLPKLTTRGYQIVGLTFVHVGIALCIDNAIRKRYRILNAASVVWVGVLSYSLYLWQQPFLNRTAHQWWTAFPANILLAFGAAIVSYFAVERPFLVMRELLKRRTTRLARRATAAAGESA